MNASGRIVEFNSAAERTFGYKRDQAVGQELAI
jgi:PAS domain S-box-containing protein